LKKAVVDALVATGAGGGQRQYDFRPPKAHTSAPPASSKPWVVQMRGKMAEESNKALYRLRQQTVEPVFGIVKSVLGFRQFRVRGLNKVQNEWCLVSLAYNCKRLHKMMAQTR
ncbi:MAG: transposase, partial [Burkholderiaceae bacterium]